MKTIKITSTPQSLTDVPATSRQAWVGLVLPLVENEVARVAQDCGRIDQAKGPYLVAAGDAFAALNKAGHFGPAADYMRGEYPEYFIFGSGCAELVV